METFAADAGRIAPQANPQCKATSGAVPSYEQREICNQGKRPSSGEMSLSSDSAL